MDNEQLSITNKSRQLESCGNCLLATGN